MSEYFVFPRYIRAPSPAPETFPGDRVKLYAWLASKLLDTRQYRVRWPKTSICITAEQMLHPSLEDVTQLLPLPDAPSEETVLDIIDIADNQYHPLSDIFLYQVARAISNRTAVSKAKLAILLPLLPADGSVFWQSMIDPYAQWPVTDGISTIVLANDGRSRPSGYLQPDDLAIYRSMVTAKDSNLLGMLRDRTVTQLGHYDLGSLDEPRCATHFFDTEAAEYEIGELVIKWARDNQIGGRQFTLISYGRRSAAMRFHRAVSGAATELGCGFQSVTSNDPMPTAWKVRGIAVLIFNVVDTGIAFRRVVNGLAAQNVPLAPRALTVLKTDPGAVFGPSYPELDVLCDAFQRKALPRKECPQCRLGLPHTPRASDTYLPIRAIDIWHILLDCTWKPETFGPSDRTFLRYAPDMAEVFVKYGNWFAYKIGDLLRTLAIQRDVVFVCPDEPHVEQLIKRLGTIMQNRQVSILIPRAALGDHESAGNLEEYQEENWFRQLSYLNGRPNVNIVLIDEFSRSFSTAHAIIRLLQHDEFKLKHRAYIPILDFAPEHIQRPASTYPLYCLPYLGISDG